MDLSRAISAVVGVYIGVAMIGPLAAQKVNRPATRPPTARPERPNKPEKQANPENGAGKKNPENHNPGNNNSPQSDAASTAPDRLEKLLKLPPAQRDKFLASVPAAKRTQIEQKLSDWQKMPEQQRLRSLDRYQKMQSLPPQKRSQVRASIQQFAALPQPRQRVVRKQLNDLKGLSDSDRRAVMNSEEFRNKFTPAEQQMIEDIASVTPEI